ncbi:MAG: hypothetical protein P4L79_10165 [Legionella sp.]|uniref:hypothetical protein n=1 Tax=Legionella sp. TaxID=459 RepID=UPI002840DD14|nr:hypothetical protein [Legionella sp.]
MAEMYDIEVFKKRKLVNKVLGALVRHPASYNEVANAIDKNYHDIAKKDYSAIDLGNTILSYRDYPNGDGIKRNWNP